MRSHIKVYTHSPTYLIPTISHPYQQLIHPLIPPRFFRGSLMRKQLGFIHSLRDHHVEDMPSTHEKGRKTKSDSLSVYQLSSLHGYNGDCELDSENTHKRETFHFRICRPAEHMHTVNTHTHSCTPTVMGEGGMVGDRVVWTRMSGRVSVRGCVDCG